MPEGEETGTAGSTTTYTQMDVDRMVRERLAREREKFKDYDDLKSRAAEADKNKSALDQLLEKFTAMEQRNAESEARALRLEVAQAKKLPAWMAKRLTGKTREELEADADEMLAEAKPAGDDDKKDDDAGKDGKTDADGSTGDGKTSTDTGSTKDTGAAGEGEGRKLPPSGRPKEKLTSGAVPATTGDKSPAELAESILKSDF